LNDLPPNRKLRQDEYEYKVEPLAVETLTNLLRLEGVITIWDGAWIVFTSDRLLNMRRLKELGIIRSYTILRVLQKNEIIEEG
jgi:hypothetical protein